MTRNCQLIVFSLAFLSIVASAVPKPEEKRILDHDFASHMGDEHSKQYDHEQFLGEDQAKTFDQLAPEESRRRLGYKIAHFNLVVPFELEELNFMLQRERLIRVAAIDSH